jgi:hypothetical protein
MTLKELLDHCDFKEIAPMIKQWYPTQEIELPYYKMAFDILRHMEPEKDPKNPNETIEIHSGYETQSFYVLSMKYDEEQYPAVTVSNCDNDFWKYNLAKEIVVINEIGLMLTDNEIAAHCLWSLTIYGFDQSTPEGIEKAFSELMGTKDTSNPYTAAAEKLKEKLPDIDSIEDDSPQQAQTERLQERIKKLERKAKVENTIKRLTANTKSFSREDVAYLFKTNRIYEYDFQSRSYNINQRIDYLIDLFSNYVVYDFEECNQFLLMFRTSPENTLAQEELDKIQNFFNRYLPASANIRYGYGTDENLGTEAGIFFIRSY